MSIHIAATGWNSLIKFFFRGSFRKEIYCWEVKTLFVSTKSVNMFVTQGLRSNVFLSWVLEWGCHPSLSMRVSWYRLRCGRNWSVWERLVLEWGCPCSWNWSCTSSRNQLKHHPQRLAPIRFPQIASFDLLDKAYHIAKDLGMTTHVGTSCHQMPSIQTTVKRTRAW